MGYSEDMASFIQYRAGVGELNEIELAMLIYRLVVAGSVATPTSTGSTGSTGSTTTTGGTVSGAVSIKDGDTAALLDVDANGRIGINNFPATQQVTGTVTIGNFPATQAISGSVAVSNQPAFVFDSNGNLRVNFPATQAITGTVSIGNFPATQPISGSVSIANFPATQPVNGTVAVSNLPALNANRVPVYRQDRALTQTFSIAVGATQSDWFSINSDSKLLLLEVGNMTGTSLQVRWRHPTGTGTGNPITDAFGTPFTLTIGGTGRTFSSDALAPLARCVMGDGEISFVSNVAEGAARSIKLYY